jgi:flagellar biosynthetic protein FliP
VPPNQVIVGLSLFMTLFVMGPTVDSFHEKVVVPYTAGEMDFAAAAVETSAIWRTFMFRHVRDRDLGLFLGLGQVAAPRTRADVPTRVLVPAFVVSELRTAFLMGFALFLPFLVIDLVVSSVLLSMGMMMLPPVMISFPFKVLLFVMVDGWNVLARSLAVSFA